MITKEEILQILGNDSIDIKHYCLLRIFNENTDMTEILTNYKVRGLVEAMSKKGYLTNIGNDKFQISNSGMNLISNTLYISSTTEVSSTDKNEYIFWLEETHKQMEDIIFNSTGRRKYLNPSGKYYNCSIKELDERIQAFFKKFKDISMENIRNAILKYTAAVVNKSIPYPVRLIFFIWNTKNNTLESELINWIDKEEQPEYGINI